jgi:hypothetical protein
MQSIRYCEWLNDKDIKAKQRHQFHLENQKQRSKHQIQRERKLK